MRKVLVFILILITIQLSLFTSSDTASAGEDSLLGCWKSLKDEEVAVKITNKFLIISFSPTPYQVRVMPMKRTDSGILLGGYIPPTEVEISINGDSLMIDWPLPSRNFIRVSDEDLVIDIGPFTVEKPAEIAEEIKQEIQVELSRRFEEEQLVRQELMLKAGGDMSAEALNKPELAEIRNRMVRSDSSNHAYLVEQVKKYGWIDPETFGLNASNAAYMIALHSGDLRLMRTALAYLEKYEGTGGPNENLYGSMADRIALIMQLPMSYCLQEYTARRGRMLIPVISDREELNENRKRLGLQDFEEYVQMQKDKGFNVKVFEMDNNGFYSPDTISHDDPKEN